MSTFLLDTHVVLWAFAQPDRLPSKVRDDIVDPRHEVFVSAATIWEVEIKRALGKLTAPDGLHDLCVERGFDPLDITFQHALTAGSSSFASARMRRSTIRWQTQCCHHAPPLSRPC